MNFFEQQEQRINKQFISIFDSVHFVSKHGKGTLQQAFSLITGSLLKKQTYLLLITPHQFKTVFVCSEKQQSQYEPYITLETIIYELKECIDHQGIGTGNPIYNLGFAKKRFVEQLVHLGMKLDEQVIFNTESPDITSVEYTDESDEWAFYQGLPNEYDSLRIEHENLKHKYQEMYNKKQAPEDYLKIREQLAKDASEIATKAKQAKCKAEDELRKAQKSIQDLEKSLEKEKQRVKNLETIIKIKDSQIAEKTEVNSSQSFSNTIQYDWQSMNAYIYPPELHLAMVIWERYYDNEQSEDISQFNSSKFNRITTDLGLYDSNLKSRIRTILTPIQRKKTTDDLIEAFEAIEFIYSDKVIRE